MSATSEAPVRPAILYSCYYSQSRAGEQFVAEHALSFQLSGTLTTYDGFREQVFRAGDLRLVKRNHLVKFNKQPPENGEFKSLSVTLDQETLRRLSLEHGYHAQKPHNSNSAVLELPMTPLYQSYLASLQPYEHLAEPGNESLLTLKLQEAVLLLLKSNPELQDVLFDFSEPGKLDLEAFMSRHFHFNVQLRRFAYLTGRSLATFKRDFEKIFHLSPSRWLLQRRLQEAYYLIKEQGKAPSQAYLEVGFEDLSHFSFAFKKMYGVAPSRI
ncbi:helix-turn-helix transcriptional regulator [Hymenobacter taeanensis]|uniref:Helix-turn-helix transcriptional regulator n=1 Tax=Hymenobacter taeanensis TaxID=2735321 RepID=A0A6M6BED8_9BACT|nr:MULTISPECIES: AraC family transcriptional regulator [Hymenobacter]QJX46312.1 helix-turn-helix transcriptional regulator [Hymenobacter taeanensis]UOQ80171.1 AraC family transcriptional regulator [Hymenobacter sp. 5414T-23]